MDRSQYVVPNHPEQSYSRRLDDMVASQELPYGYDGNPPAYDHENTVPKEQVYKKKGK